MIERNEGAAGVKGIEGTRETRGTLDRSKHDSEKSAAPSADQLSTMTSSSLYWTADKAAWPGGGGRARAIHSGRVAIALVECPAPALSSLILCTASIHIQSSA